MNQKNPNLAKIIKCLEDAQAIEITEIDVQEHTTITDVMIICNGRSSRHVKAIAEQLLEQMKTAGLIALSATGFDSGDWVLIDFGDFIVHIMQPDARAFYNLEGLWQH